MSIVLGIVLNVIMAVVAGSFPIGSEQYDRTPDESYLTRIESLGVTRFEFDILVLEGQTSVPIENQIGDLFRRAHTSEFEPGVDIRFFDFPIRYMSYSTASIECWGLPFRCFWCWNSTTMSMTGALPPGSGGDLRQADVSRMIPWLWAPVGSDPIPFYPLWPGLIANTLIYATLSLGMLTGLPAARRALRRRRGHCPMCNYNLTGNATGRCPECGHINNPTRKT